MTFTADVTLILSDVAQMLSVYIVPFVGFFIIALPARIAFKMFHKSLNNYTKF
ncbi:MAG: hypothetical protein KAI16_02585 [Candidatus Pacebacteria bacterium]|nr:hypothetical protein [Candidatus Paceibacterota bacterium]